MGIIDDCTRAVETMVNALTFQGKKGKSAEDKERERKEEEQAESDRARRERDERDRERWRSAR